MTSRPRIVDFSTHLSGPIASYLLRDLGAEVVKVENPRTGDGLRHLEPSIAGVGKYHAGVNAGARSVAFDSRSDDWPTLVAACARWADAVIVGGRPIDSVRRGLDFATVRSAAPDVVYCSISGYGDRGPLADALAHGQNVDAWAGLLPVDWDADQPRTPEGWRSSGTVLAGVFGALGVMAALYHREIGTPSSYVTTSMWSAAMWSNWRDLNLIANNGHASVEYQLLGSRYAMYATSDDRALLICPIEEQFWVRFCEAAGLPDDWKANGDWSNKHVDYGYEAERATIAEAIRAKPLEQWLDMLKRVGVPVAPVLTPHEALAGEHAQAVGVMRSVPVGNDSAVIAASPVRLADDDHADVRPKPLGAPPELGDHTLEFLAELGLSGLITSKGR